MRPTWVVFLALAVTLPLRAADDALAFTRVLQRDAIEALALLPAAARRAVRDQIERYDCIEVRRAEATVVDANTVRVELDATGVTIGGHRVVETLPRLWIVRKAEGKTVSVVPLERDGARRVAAAADSERPRLVAELLREPGIDRARLTWELANESTEGAYPRWLADEAHRMAIELGDPALLSFTLQMLSLHMRDPDIVTDAYAAAAASEDTDALCGALFSLAFNVWHSGDLELATRLFAASADLTPWLRDPRKGLMALYMAGLLRQIAGRLTEVLETAHELEASSVRYGWEEGRLKAAMQLGQLYSAVKDKDTSQHYYQMVLASPVADETTRIYAIFNTGVWQLETGDVVQAERTMRRAIAEGRGAIPRLAHAHMRSTLAQLLMNHGRLAEAEPLLVQAVAEVSADDEKGFAFSAAVNLGNLRLLQGDAHEALCQARMAVAASAEKTLNLQVHEHGPAKLLAARALRKLGRDAEALAELDDALMAIETKRAALSLDPLTSTAFFHRETDTYVERVAIHAHAGRAEEALAAAERMKARVLNDLVHMKSNDPRLAMTDEERAREDALEDAIVQLNRAIGRAPGKAAALRAKLTDAREKLRRFRTMTAVLYAGSFTAPVEERPLPAKLPSSLRTSAIVEYVVTDEETIAIVLAPERDGQRTARVHVLPIQRAALTKRVEALVRAVEQRDLLYGEAARALHELLLQPLGESVAGAPMLCIIPDDVLWKLPFQVLQAGDGRHLAERTDLFYAPSLSVLQQTAAKPRPKSGGTVLALANPLLGAGTVSLARAVYRDPDLGPLPDAEEEVQALRGIYGKERTKIYVRGAARESVLKREVASAAIVHLATHGIADARAPMHSALFLSSSGDEKEDGVLEAREILELPLNARLAVLSACDTARGGIAHGEGVIGLAWALLGAGCPTTVASQWKTDSAATAALMIDFHQHLAAGATTAGALRAAQKERMRAAGHGHPFYWGPFIVIGAP
ncbi:MAG TPA: CHAT domain-containing protein [Thermoanaerobaculia bacterium]